MTKAEGVAIVGTGGTWMGAITAFAAQALPLLQGIVAIAAIAVSVCTVLYIRKKTRLLDRDRP